MALPAWAQAAVKFSQYTPAQQKIAKQLAAQGVQSAFPAGGAPNIAQWVTKESYKIADTLFAPKQEAPKAQPKPAPAPVETKTETPVEVTPETKVLQEETQKLMDELTTTKTSLTDTQKQFDLYKEEQAAIKAEQESTASAQFANKAMANLAPTLQIGGAASTPLKTGTSAFKIKKPGTTSTSTMTPLNIGSSSTLNI